MKGKKTNPKQHYVSKNHTLFTLPLITLVILSKHVSLIVTKHC